MKGVNKVILIGNAGKEPEYKLLQDGTPVARLTIATTESYRLKNGDVQSHTEWHAVIVWRGLANLTKEYIHKGSHLYIEGKLRNRQYAGKDGHKQNTTEIIADQVIMLDKKLKITVQGTEEAPNEELPF